MHGFFRYRKDLKTVLEHVLAYIALFVEDLRQSRHRRRLVCGTKHFKHGADINGADDFGFSPLHRMIQSNDVDGVALLLFFPTVQMCRFAPGEETPLHLAAYENSDLLAELLLAFVRSLHTKTTYNRVFIQYCRSCAVLLMIGC